MEKMNEQIFFIPGIKELSPREFFGQSDIPTDIRYSEASICADPCELTDDEHDALRHIFLSEAYPASPDRLLQ